MKGTTPEAAGKTLFDTTLGPFIKRGFRLIDSREGSLTGGTRPCFDVYMVGDKQNPGALLKLEFKAHMYRNIIGFDDCPRDTTVGTLTVRPWLQPYPGSGWHDFENYDLPYLAFDIHTTDADFNVLKLLRELFTIIDTSAHELTRGFDTFSWESVRTYALYFEVPKHYEWELDDVEPAEFSPEQVKVLNALIEAGKRLKP